MRSILPLVLAAAVCAAETAPEPTTLTAKPTSVSRSTNLWFEEGTLRGGQDQLQIGLQAALGSKLRVVDIEQVELVEAVGDDGKPLQASEHGAGGGGGSEPGNLELSVMLAPPAVGVHAIRSLTVSAKARVAAEGLRRASLKPAKDWIAKRLRIDGLAGGEVELEDLGAETLTLGMTPAVEKALESMSFHTADGGDVESNGWNDNQEPGWTVRKVQVSLPADGVIQLDLRQELGSRVFVVTAKNIPIALPNRAKEPVGTLKTEVVQPANDVAPAAEVEVRPVAAPPAKPGF